MSKRRKKKGLVGDFVRFSRISRLRSAYTVYNYGNPKTADDVAFKIIHNLINDMKRTGDW